MRTRFTGYPVSAVTTRPEIVAVPWARSTCAEVSRVGRPWRCGWVWPCSTPPGYAHEQEEGDADGAGGAATFDHCVNSVVKLAR